MNLNNDTGSPSSVARREGLEHPHWPEEKRGKRAFSALTRFVCSDRGI